ncbi:acyl-CoA dehydrogenase family protein [Shimia sp.]|uniref:acyl-CoA dehydrogenase family protein n=1 Tax=Shimia sp. TaxID=1954381 RepID=UPI003B8E4985
MTKFIAPVEDILLSLEKVAGADSLPEWDRDLASEILSHFGAFAEGVIAPLNERGAQQSCQLENGRVHMPDGFKDAFEQLAEMGWQGLTAPEHHGGMEQSALVAAGVSEIFSGANLSMQMVCNLVPGAISTLRRFGNAEQQSEWIPKLAAGEALSTMCLTEPGAGSDLSRIRTKATQDGNRWVLEGEKIFISGGDQDLSDDILHLVLARTGAKEDGVKGLSLFLTSKKRAGASIKITRIEEKMGLHASPTCQMAFDGCPAELIGEKGTGLSAMFVLMNHARLDVSLQGVAHAAHAHQIAKAYASERKQGRRPDGSEAVLTDHADVRRMLDQQRCLEIGARGMAHVALVELMRGERPALVEFLTPLCKVFCTEAGISAANLGIQILGGYGYLTEYGLAQTWADARITAIYEGANGIHELAVATRGLRQQGGAGADAFDALIAELTDNPTVLELRQVWRATRDTVRNADDPTVLAHDFSQLSCALFHRAICARMADATSDPEYVRLRDFALSRHVPVSTTLA